MQFNLSELIYESSNKDVHKVFENNKIGDVTDPTQDNEQVTFNELRPKLAKIADWLEKKVGSSEDINKELESFISSLDNPGIEDIKSDGVFNRTLLNRLTAIDITGTNFNINPVNVKKGADQESGATSIDVNAYKNGAQIIPFLLEVDGPSAGVGESFYVLLMPLIGSVLKEKNKKLHSAVFNIEIPVGEDKKIIWTSIEEIPVLMLNSSTELEELKAAARLIGDQSLSKFKKYSIKLNQRRTQRPSETSSSETSSSKTNDSFNRKGTMIHEQYDLSDAFLITEHQSPSAFLKVIINFVKKTQDPDKFLSGTETQIKKAFSNYQKNKNKKYKNAESKDLEKRDIKSSFNGLIKDSGIVASKVKVIKQALNKLDSDLFGHLSEGKPVESIVSNQDSAESKPDTAENLEVIPIKNNVGTLALVQDSEESDDEKEEDTDEARDTSSTDGDDSGDGAEVTTDAGTEDTSKESSGDVDDKKVSLLKDALSKSKIYANSKTKKHLETEDRDFDPFNTEEEDKPKFFQLKILNLSLDEFKNNKKVVKGMANEIIELILFCQETSDMYKAVEKVLGEGWYTKFQNLAYNASSIPGAIKSKISKDHASTVEREAGSEVGSEGGDEAGTEAGTEAGSTKESDQEKEGYILAGLLKEDTDDEDNKDKEYVEKFGINELKNPTKLSDGADNVTYLLHSDNIVALVILCKKNNENKQKIENVLGEDWFKIAIEAIKKGGIQNNIEDIADKEDISKKSESSDIEQSDEDKRIEINAEQEDIKEALIQSKALFFGSKDRSNPNFIICFLNKEDNFIRLYSTFKTPYHEIKVGAGTKGNFNVNTNFALNSTTALSKDLINEFIIYVLNNDNDLQVKYDFHCDSDTSIIDNFTESMKQKIKRNTGIDLTGVRPGIGAPSGHHEDLEEEDQAQPLKVPDISSDWRNSVDEDLSNINDNTIPPPTPQQSISNEEYADQNPVDHIKDVVSSNEETKQYYDDADVKERAVVRNGLLAKQTLSQMIQATNLAIDKAIASLPSTIGGKGVLNNITKADEKSIENFDGIVKYNKKVREEIIAALEGSDDFANSKYVTEELYIGKAKKEETTKKTTAKKSTAKKTTAEEDSNTEILVSSKNYFYTMPLSGLLFESSGTNVNTAAMSIADIIQLATVNAQIEIQNIHNKHQLKMQEEDEKVLRTRQEKAYQISRITQYSNYADLKRRIDSTIFGIINQLETQIIDQKLSTLQARGQQYYRDRTAGIEDMDNEHRDKALAAVTGTVTGVFGVGAVAGATGIAISGVGAASGIVGTAGAIATGGLMVAGAVFALPVIGLAGYTFYQRSKRKIKNQENSRKRDRLIRAQEDANAAQREELDIDRLKVNHKRAIMCLNEILKEVCSRIEVIRNNPVFKEYIGFDQAAQTTSVTGAESANAPAGLHANFNIIYTKPLSVLLFEDTDNNAKVSDTINYSDIKPIIEKHIPNLIKADSSNMIPGLIEQFIDTITGCGDSIKGLPAPKSVKSVVSDYIPKDVQRGKPMLQAPSGIPAMIGAPTSADQECSVMQVLNILNNAGRRDLMISFLSSLSSQDKEYYKQGDSFSGVMENMSSDDELDSSVKKEILNDSEANEIINTVREDLFNISQENFDKLLKLEGVFGDLDNQLKKIKSTLSSFGIELKEDIKNNLLEETKREDVLNSICNIDSDSKELSLDFIFNYLSRILAIEIKIDFKEDEDKVLNNSDILSLIRFNSSVKLLEKIDETNKKKIKKYKKESEVHKRIFKAVAKKIKESENEKLKKITSKGSELKLENDYIYASGIKQLLKQRRVIYEQ
jgi:hypothetical protein